MSDNGGRVESYEALIEKAANQEDRALTSIKSCPPAGGGARVTLGSGLGVLGTECHYKLSWGQQNPPLFLVAR